MGGGSWNGKNYGGLHTGADKKQNVGPYSSDGYRPNPFLSNLDFVTGDEVIYIGNPGQLNGSVNTHYTKIKIEEQSTEFLKNVKYYLNYQLSSEDNQNIDISSGVLGYNNGCYNFIMAQNLY